MPFFRLSRRLRPLDAVVTLVFLASAPFGATGCANCNDHGTDAPSAAPSDHANDSGLAAPPRLRKLPKLGEQPTFMPLAVDAGTAN